MPTLLIVDDSSSALALLQSYFEPYFECDTATGGKEAIAQFRAALDEGRDYAGILMDVVMPEVNGVEAVKQIVRIMDTKHIPRERRPRIMLVSAHTNVKAVIDAQYECGADGYVSKNAGREALLESLENHGILPPSLVQT